MTTYFLIGNLGETKLKYMNIEELSLDKWFDDESINGFKIDGLSPNAGNIPTGNGSEKKRSRFITTVSELVAKYEEVYRDVPDRKKALKGDLSAMLASAVLLNGSETMVDEFRRRIAAIEATEARRFITKKMLAEDEKKFLLEPDNKLAEKIELKDQIYRYPTILLFDMKIYFKLSSSQCWSAIDELVEEGVIPATGGKDLEVLVATALFIRLSAYSHYGSQNNNITIWTADRKSPETGVRREMWTISKTLLQLFFTHLLPAKNAVQKLVKGGEEVDEDGDASRDALRTVGLTLYYCEDYESFLTLSASAPGSCTKTEDWKVMTLVAYRESNRFNEAIEMAHDMIWSGDLNLRCESGVYCELGSIYYAQGEYAKALECYNKCLAIRLTVYGDSNHPDIAISYCTIGLVYRAQGEYGKALEFHKKCLAIQLAVYGGSNHPDIATSYGSIGSVYRAQGEYGRALEFYNKCLVVELAMHGNKNHLAIATCYSNIGSVYREKGEYGRALEFYNKSLAILS